MSVITSDDDSARPVTTKLSDNEKALLAREIAIDQYGYRSYGMQAFTDGWDAAMEHVEKHCIGKRTADTEIEL